MTVQELRNKSDVELRALLVVVEREQFTLRIQSASGQPVKADKIRALRKTVARIKCILSEKG